MAIRFSSGVTPQYATFSKTGLPTAALSACCWFRATESGIFHYPINCLYSDASYNYHGWYLWVTNTGKIQGAVANNNANYYYRRGESTTSLNDGKWYHLAMTWAGSGAIMLYVNGVEESSYTTNATPPASVAYPAALSCDFARYTYGWGAPSYGAGFEIFDARIYNRRISDAEVSTINAMQGADTFVDGLLRRWLMLEKAEGETLPDTSGFIRDTSGNGGHATSGSNGHSAYYAAPLRLFPNRVLY